MARAHTVMGEAMLHSLLPDYKMGREVELTDPPQVFFAEAPPKIRIGLVSPATGEVTKVHIGTLQS